MSFKKMFNTSKRISIWVVSVILIVALYLIAFDRVAPSTSDSILGAYVIKIRPEVQGLIHKIYIKNNQLVKKGDPLLMIEPSVYKYQYEQSRANLFETQDQVLSLERSVGKAQNLLKDAESDYSDILVQFNKDKILYDSKAIDLRSFLDSQDRLNQAEKTMQNSELSLIQVKGDLGPKFHGVNIHLLKAEAALKLDAYYLHKTLIKAPSDGYATGMRISEGSYAEIGETQLAFIDNSDWWILANLKENNLGKVRPGQRVDVSLSLYPGVVFEGYVDSIDWGVMNKELEGSNYLSSVTKTNNWVHLAQRFPAKIRLKNVPKDCTLRVGASALVTIYTDENDFLNFLPKMVHSLRSKLQYIY
jgi:multidrug resistance efflux pump